MSESEIKKGSEKEKVETGKRETRREGERVGDCGAVSKGAAGERRGCSEWSDRGQEGLSGADRICYVHRGKVVDHQQ